VFHPVKPVDVAQPKRRSTVRRHSLFSRDRDVCPGGPLSNTSGHQPVTTRSRTRRDSRIPEKITETRTQPRRYVVVNTRFRGGETRGRQTPSFAEKRKASRSRANEPIASTRTVQTCLRLTRTRENTKTLVFRYRSREENVTHQRLLYARRRHVADQLQVCCYAGLVADPRTSVRSVYETL